MWHGGGVDSDVTVIVSAVDELDIILIEAKRTTEDHVKAEREAGELQQTREWSASG